MKTVLRIRYYGSTYIATDLADSKRKVTCTSGDQGAAFAWMQKYHPNEKLNAISKASHLHLGGIDTSKDKKSDQVTYWIYEADPTPSKTITVSKPHALPALKTIAADIEKATVSIQAAERTFARATLADRIWLGVLCLAAKEHHAIDPSKRSKGQNQHTKVLTSTRRSEQEPTALVIHPQGFLSWLSIALDGVAQPTAYKYMDAAKGIGLDAWSTEQEVRKLVAQRLQEFDARQIPLTLGMLAAQGKTVEPGETTKGKSTVQEIKTDAVQTLFTFMDEVVNVKDALTPIEHDAVVNRLAEILRRLTGKEWNPGA